MKYFVRMKVANDYDNLLCLWLFDDAFLLTNFIFYTVKSCGVTNGY
jgi:hypothetical protein